MSYGIALNNSPVETFNFNKFIFILLGGLLVTASSNSFNQIWERKYDAIMSRTQNRPLPTNRLTIFESIIFSTFIGVIGIYCLFLVNYKSALLGFVAMALYILIYTPTKRITTLCVFLGAFPGSLPAMIGYIAITNDFSLTTGLMFLVQFVWQFPHFWSIAWLSLDDYKKAGYKMLPLSQNKNKNNALVILITSILTIPSGVLPCFFNITTLFSLICAILLSSILIFYSIKLYNSNDDQYARKLMFASFAYLPLIFMVYLFDSIFFL